MIKRYYPNHDHCDMDEELEGEWVKYTDLERTLKALKDLIEAIYIEGENHHYNGVVNQCYTNACKVLDEAGTNDGIYQCLK